MFRINIFQMKEVMSMKFARSMHRIQVNIQAENRSDRCSLDNTDYQQRFASKLMNHPVYTT